MPIEGATVQIALDVLSASFAASARGKAKGLAPKPQRGALETSVISNRQSGSAMVEIIAKS